MKVHILTEATHCALQVAINDYIEWLYDNDYFIIDIKFAISDLDSAAAMVIYQENYRP